MKKNRRIPEKTFADKPLICLISKGEATSENFTAYKNQFLKLVKIAVRNKISIIQIREKKLSARLVFRLTKETAKITKQTETKLLVNDRADIAFAAGADGVHLTENSLPVEIIRRSFPKDFIIGVSTHSIEKTRLAKIQNADFAAFSPVFSSPGKAEPKGLEKLKMVCESVRDFRSSRSAELTNPISRRFSMPEQTALRQFGF